MRSIITFLALLCAVACGCSSNPKKDENPPVDVPPTAPPDDDTEDAATAVPGVQDAGNASTPPKDASVDRTSDSGPPTQASCLAACQIDHPVGAVLAGAVDACWKTSCDPACTMGDPDGKTHGPAGDVVCTFQVLTPTVECSTCTVLNCCAAWDALFGSPEGVALNLCSLPCWALPL